MNRRLFLQKLVVASGAVCFPEIALYGDNPVKIRELPAELGIVREIVFDNIYSGCYVARYDIGTKNKEIFIAFDIKSATPDEMTREKAVNILVRDMGKHGIRINDLIVLDLPILGNACYVA